MQKAVKNVTDIIAPKLIGLEACGQRTVDSAMRKLDGTETKIGLCGGMKMKRAIR